LRPFEAPIDSVVDVLQAYIALRCAGYWVDGFVLASRSPHTAWAKACEALQAVVQIAKAGAPCRELVNLADEKIKPYSPHPMTAGNVGNSIGCFLDEAPQILATSDDRLEPGCVYMLRAGASDGRKQHAIASAIVSVNAQNAEMLWPLA
jgi:hypothetical protein